ncbi:MAG: porin family protein [Catalinimonas sp.]
MNQRNRSQMAARRRQTVGWGVLLCVALSLGAVRAQAFRGLIIVGATGAQVDGDGLGGYSKGGFVGGVGVDLPTSERWGWRGEMLYSQKGARTSNRELEQFLPFFVLRLNYLDVPLTGRYRIIDNLVAEGGLMPSVLLSAKTDVGVGFVDDEEGFNPYDVSGLIGMEYAAFDNLSFGLRFSYSLLPMNRLAIGVTNARSTAAYNKVISFTARYLLGNGTEPPPKK